MLQYAAPPAEHHRPVFLEPPSRPQSTNPTFSLSVPKQSQPFDEQSYGSARSPALSALASLAASVPAAPLLDEKER